jgi:hypothetical protein
LIFKGKGVNNNLFSDHLPTGWAIGASAEGWTTDMHGQQWLQDCFDPATKEKAANKPRVLICDGHKSHITGNFIDFCLKNNIRLLIIPPHASHIVQPLDLACFGPLKTLLSGKLGRIAKLGM